MRSDMLTIIRKEFARFFKDKKMVFTTVLMPGLMIYFLYTFMGQGMMKEFETDDAYVANAYVTNMPEEFAPMFDELSAEWTEVTEAEKEDIKQQIQDKEADVLVVFPKDFVNAVASYDVASGEAAPNVEIYYNSTETESANLRSILREMLNEYESSMANKMDVNAGDIKYDVATEEDVTGQIFAMLFPMLLMTFMFSGCMAIAPESIAGEKERGTIATLLVTPMKRSAFALGKIISLSCIALLSGLSSFLGTMLSLPNLYGDAEGMSTSVYALGDYMLLFVVIMTTVLVLISLIAVISAFASSIKEASTAVTPLMIVVMVISILPMLGGSAEKTLGMFCIPVYNSVLCIQGIFSFTCEPVFVAVTAVVNVLCTAVLTAVLTKMFNNEKIMFSK